MYKKIYEDLAKRDPNYYHKLCCCHCGKKFLSFYPLRRYCSYRCKNDAWIARRKMYREYARHKNCEYCGKRFKAKRKDAKYCCSLHRVLAFQHRRKKTNGNSVRVVSGIAAALRTLARLSSSEKADRHGTWKNTPGKRFVEELAVNKRGEFEGLALFTAKVRSEYSTPSRSTHCPPQVGGEARDISSVKNSTNPLDLRNNLQNGSFTKLVGVPSATKIGGRFGKHFNSLIRAKPDPIFPNLSRSPFNRPEVSEYALVHILKEARA